MKKVTVYAGRLNFTFEKTVTNPEKIERENIIKMVSKNENLAEDEDFFWRFGGIRILENKNIILGRVGKIRKSRLMTEFDDKTNDFIEKKTDIKFAYSSNFCIFLDKNLILFERKFGIGFMEIKNKIEEIFTDMCKIEMEIELLKDKKEVMKIIQESDKLIEIDFSIRPTNPDSDEDMKVIDNLLKQSKAKKARMKFENKIEGLETKEKNIISSGIALCSKGYGSYRIKAKKGDRETTIDSVKKIIKESEVPPKHGEELEFFFKVLKAINKRLA